MFEGEVKIRTSDNYVIRSDYAEYNKDLGIVKLKGNISALDEKDNKIITNEAIYNEKLKTLKSIGLTEVTTSENYNLQGKDIFLDNSKNLISSESETTITDKESNKIYLKIFLSD